jgi:hypothetical protein
VNCGLVDVEPGTPDAANSDDDQEATTDPDCGGSFDPAAEPGAQGVSGFELCVTKSIVFGAPTLDDFFSSQATTLYEKRGKSSHTRASSIPGLVKRGRRYSNETHTPRYIKGFI